MELCKERRGIFVDMNNLDKTRVELHYILPLNEIIYDFFDALKAAARDMPLSTTSWTATGRASL